MLRRPSIFAVLILFLVALARTATYPSDACIVAYSGAFATQRSTRFVLVPNNTFALQAIPAAASTGLILLPPGFNYSLSGLFVALDATMPWSNATAAVELAFYQSASAKPPGTPKATRAPRYTLNTAGQDFLQIGNSGFTFGEVPVNASERMWVGVRLNGQPALALSMSTFRAPSADIVAYNCTANLLLTTLGCTSAVSPHMIFSQIKMFVQPCPCGLPQPNGATACTFVSGTATNLTLVANQTVTVDTDAVFTISGEVSIPGSASGVAPIVATKCTEIDPNSTLVLSAADVGASDATQSILVIGSPCVSGRFAAVTVENTNPKCLVTAEQQDTPEGLAVTITPSPSCRDSNGGLPRWVIPVAVVGGVMLVVLGVIGGLFTIAKCGKRSNFLFHSTGDEETYVIDR